jgi:hypothetical protein
MLVFLDVRRKYPQLKGGNWKTDLAFFVVVLEHLNNLKRHSSGKTLLIHELRTEI